MKQLKVLLAVGALGVAGAAHADFGSTVTVVSDYDFRGFSQTLNDAALQVSLDYSAEGGFYAGIWGSNIDEGFYSYTDPVTGIFSSARTEVDGYAGFKFGNDNFTFDVGATYYTYAGASDYNYAEVYGKFSFNVLTVGAYYSDDFGGKATGDGSDTAYYVFGDVNIPAGPLTVALHAGMSDGEGIEEAVLLGADDNYMDVSIGLLYSSNNFTTGIKWIAVDAGDAGSDDRIVLSVSTTLPWAN
jgi:uncharacterized protein (TIGR02001 family)